MDITLELYALPEKFRYEIQMLIREFLPFAGFSDAGEITVQAGAETVRLTDGVQELAVCPDPALVFENEPLKNRIKAALYDVLSQYTGRTAPWGILTGVRPTKIAFTALDRGMEEAQLIDHLCRDYRLQPDKARLMTRTAVRERALLAGHCGTDVSLYVGIPFCPTRCAYCSFVSYDFSRYQDLADAYIQALIHEMEESAPMIRDRRLQSFYMGGGTPSVLSAHQMDRLLTAVDTVFGIRSFSEFTVEAGRPDTITPEKLAVLKAHGVSRISINPQTLNQATLDRVGRRHTVEQIYEAFDMARAAGFASINMDFILGLPGETVEDVERSMAGVRDLRPENLTIHTLAIKRSSRLNQEGEGPELVGQGERVAAMLAVTQRTAEELGLAPYYMYRQKNMAGNFENVGYSLPGRECIYNIEIMEERQSILAFGAGAVSKIYYPAENRLERGPNVKNLVEYIERTEEMILRKRKELLHG